MKILVVLLVTLAFASAKPAPKGKGPKGPPGPPGPPGVSSLGRIARFCDDVVEGEIENDDSDLDAVFTAFNSSCEEFLDLLDEELDSGEETETEEESTIFGVPKFYTFYLFSLLLTAYLLSH